MLRSAQSTLAALVLFVLLGSSPVLLAQSQEPKEGQPKFWKLNGFRHGKNYFPITNLVETTPKVEGEWDFEHYHMYDEMLVWFDKWAKEYPDLIDLYVGGVSLEGRDIMQLTLTNKKTGADTDKPAMLIDANRHAGEVTAGGATNSEE